MSYKNNKEYTNQHTHATEKKLKMFNRKVNENKMCNNILYRDVYYWTINKIKIKSDYLIKPCSNKP